MSNADGVEVQSVARALQLVDCFAERKTLGISGLAELTGLKKSTVYGLVNTLCARGYLEQTDESRKYRLGLRLFELGNLVGERMDLRSEARELCMALSLKYRQTVHLATPLDGEVVYIDKFDVPDFIVVYSSIGKRAPMSCTGVGKAMLAFMSESYVARVVEKGLVPRTPNTLMTEEALQKDLRAVRERGYAIDNEEIALGLKCVAAPVFNHKGEPIAALSVSGMAARMTEDVMSELAADVVHCAGRVSEKLGYKSGTYTEFGRREHG